MIGHTSKVQNAIELDDGKIESASNTEPKRLLWSKDGELIQ